MCFTFFVCFRFSPTRAPSPWNGIRIADKFSPVCPQRLPNIQNETGALEKMPKGRLEYLKRLLPFLQNQSEDCLYLNVFSPAHGMYLSLCVFWVEFFFFTVSFLLHRSTMKKTTYSYMDVRCSIVLNSEFQPRATKKKRLPFLFVCICTERKNDTHNVSTTFEILPLNHSKLLTHKICSCNK